MPLGRQGDAGVHRGAGALVDQGAVPEYLHRFDGSREAGGNGSRHLHGRDNGRVVVGGGDGHSARAGEGGGQIVRSAMPMLEEGDGAGRYEKDEAENDVLDEAALGTGRVHRRIRTNTPLASFRQKAGFYLDALLWKG
jgi:hypothetical protein